jgi:hypothetical protein
MIVSNGVYYTILGNDQQSKYKLDMVIESANQWSLLQIAMAIGEDYLENHQDDNTKWPLVVRIYTDDEKVLGDYQVEMEMKPMFYARVKK